MVAAELFRALFDYHYALYDRIWASIEQLTDDQFVQPLDYSHGSIRDQMVHVARTDLAWIRGLRGDPNARTFVLDPAAYPDPASGRALWREVAEEVTAYIASLDEAALNEAAPGTPGPRWQALAHVVNHGTDHRAQILRALADFGAPTFDQDMIYHLWRR